jgi:hypothetical protein
MITLNTVMNGVVGCHVLPLTSIGLRDVRDVLGSDGVGQSESIVPSFHVELSGVGDGDDTEGVGVEVTDLGLEYVVGLTLEEHGALTCADCGVVLLTGLLLLLDDALPHLTVKLCSEATDGAVLIEGEEESAVYGLGREGGRELVWSVDVGLTDGDFSAEVEHVDINLDVVKGEGNELTSNDGLITQTAGDHDEEEEGERERERRKERQRGRTEKLALKKASERAGSWKEDWERERSRDDVAKC